MSRLLLEVVFIAVDRLALDTHRLAKRLRLVVGGQQSAKASAAAAQRRLTTAWLHGENQRLLAGPEVPAMRSRAVQRRR
jgi:hypothetical protein